MKIGVVGLWHLGTVVAACLAKAGFDTVGVDDHAVVAGLSAGRAPLFEPGLDDLLKAGIGAGKLSFSADAASALRDADILWVTYDTPVDEDDRADVGFVVDRVAALLPILRRDTVVLVSSQVPVGTTSGMRDRFHDEYPGRHLRFAYSPENLRLGKAISSFVDAARIVFGVDAAETRIALEPLAARLGTPAVWMGLESAEMVKHTINAFLATSVTFINEIACVCERVGADAADVEAGIRSEPRIGPRAYVTPGGAFAGGTLARDVGFLTTLAEARGLSTPLLAGILPSNHLHSHWALKKIIEIIADGDVEALRGIRVGVLGLTYKPGTSTLRRSTSVELCLDLSKAGAQVQAFDPAVPQLPAELAAAISLAASIEDAVAGADVLIIATEWTEFATLDPAFVVSAMRRPVVIDQNGFLARSFSQADAISYYRVGKPR